MEEISLLWPSSYLENVKALADKRKSLPDSMSGDLDLSYISEAIYPGNGSFVQNVLTLMCEDIDVIRYRQQILKDFIEQPQFGWVYFECLSTIYAFKHTVEAKSHGTESFIGLMSNIEGISTYIETIHRLSGFYEENQGKIKSEGLKNLFGSIVKYHSSEDFVTLTREITKLKSTFNNTIKSVTIGINFNNVMKPIEAAILSFDNKPIKKNTLLSTIFNKNKSDTIGFNTPLHKIEETTGGIGLDTALFKDLGEISGQLLNGFNIVLKTCYKENMDFLIKLENEFRFYTGAAKLMEDLGSHGLGMCIPQALQQDLRIFEVGEMTDLSFAIKLMRGDRKLKLGSAVVANDIHMNKEENIFILTGPNNGGKTTFTRAIGIVQILFQAGLCVPAQTAAISPADWIYTHFPEREKIGLDSSRLAMECKQFKTTFENVTANSLVLLNESISSTTPTECLFIAQEIVKILRYIKCRAIYTTHLIELVDKLEEIENAVQNDGKIGSLVAGIEENKSEGISFKRTFKITAGQPYKNSYAKDVFRKFGIDLEQVMENRSGTDKYANR